MKKACLFAGLFLCLFIYLYILLKKVKLFKMSPIFKCLICRKDIERSTKTFWIKKGHLLCSTCLDNIEKNPINKT